METLLKVDGMHCGGCVKSVTNALNAVEGVTGVEVSLDKGTARIVHRDGVAASSLVEALDDAGYEAEAA